MFENLCPVTTVFPVALLVLLTSIAAADEPEVILPCDSCNVGCDSGPKTLFEWAACTEVCEEDAEETEEDTIVTDRPDFTESSSTVGRGRVQVEVGYTYTHDRAAGVTTHSNSFPEPLFRIGLLSEWLELRIGWNYATQKSTGTPAVDGSEDLYLGFKLALTPQEGCLPEMAIIPQMLVPMGIDSFSGKGVLPGLNWVYSWEINDFLAIGGSTQVNRALDDVAHYYVELAQSATAAYSLTDRLGAYTEWFAFFPSSSIDPGTSPAHYANGGFTFLVTNNFQLDVRVGVGLNRQADDFFVGTGASYRY